MKKRMFSISICFVLMGLILMLAVPTVLSVSSIYTRGYDYESHTYDYTTSHEYDSYKYDYNVEYDYTASYYSYYDEYKDYSYYHYMYQSFLSRLFARFPVLENFFDNFFK